MKQVVWLGAMLLLITTSAGCVSQAKADAQAKQAFLAGQQQAMQMMKMEQARGPSVTFIGPVQTPVVPGMEGLTLARAIVVAGYHGPEPSDIIIVRNGQGTRIDPAKLLGGEDVPLESGDVINIK
jgi:hypothetical protein